MPHVPSDDPSRFFPPIGSDLPRTWQLPPEAAHLAPLLDQIIEVRPYYAQGIFERAWGAHDNAPWHDPAPELAQMERDMYDELALAGRPSRRGSGLHQFFGGVVETVAAAGQAVLWPALAAAGLGTVASATTAAAAAAQPEPSTGAPPVANGLVATNGGFPWTTLIQQVGAVAGQVLPALVNGHRRNGGSLGGATPLEPGMVMPTAWAGGLMPALGAGAGLAVRAAGRLAPILARIAGTVGRRVTPKNVVALVRRVGPEAAAAALGVTAAELLAITAHETMRPRRRRGISARDISRCRSTIRRMRSFMGMLGPMGARRSYRVSHVPSGFRHRRR